MSPDYKIIEAVILAGGKGSRLQNAVNDRPKPMAVAAGRPFVEWLLLALRSQGIHRVIFCIGYMGEKIKEYFGNGAQWDMQIVYSSEPTLMGTGGAVRQALNQIRSDRFLVLNGDSYCCFDINRLEKTHMAYGARATLWLVWMDDCRRYGSIAVGKDGVVKAFHEKAKKKCPGLINAGVYCSESSCSDASSSKRSPARAQASTYGVSFGGSCLLKRQRINLRQVQNSSGKVRHNIPSET